MLLTFGWKDFAPLPSGWKELREELGEGSKCKPAGGLASFPTDNFEDIKLWSRFIRLFEDYLDLHLFCVSILMKAMLIQASEVYVKEDDSRKCPVNSGLQLSWRWLVMMVET